jgi:hypothetical protein
LGTATLDDSFRLNELVCNAVDQGILPLLLTASFLFRQRFCGKRFLFNKDIYEEKTNEKLGEVDLIFNIGTLIGLAEVKADRGFEDRNQIDRLLNISKRINADLILFSTLKIKDSAEVNDLISYLISKEVNMPMFILTREALFERGMVIMQEYTKYIRLDDKSPKTPILIEKLK